MKRQVTCPYCKFQQAVIVSLVQAGRSSRVVACDLESGGCDEEFVLDVETTITASVRTIGRLDESTAAAISDRGGPAEGEDWS